jgi:hypothetical protein
MKLLIYYDDLASYRLNKLTESGVRKFFPDLVMPLLLHYNQTHFFNAARQSFVTTK